jgi:hypothetical protein
MLIDPHQILPGKKTERRMLAGNQELFPPGAAAEIASPAANEPPFEE